MEIVASIAVGAWINELSWFFLSFWLHSCVVHQTHKVPHTFSSWTIQDLIWLFPFIPNLFLIGLHALDFIISLFSFSTSCFQALQSCPFIASSYFITCSLLVWLNPPPSPASSKSTLLEFFFIQFCQQRIIIRFGCSIAHFIH